MKGTWAIWGISQNGGNREENTSPDATLTSIRQKMAKGLSTIIQHWSNNIFQTVHNDTLVPSHLAAEELPSTILIINETRTKKQEAAKPAHLKPKQHPHINTN